MAGIGFRLRKILKKGTLLSIFQAYGYSAVIGSGSWVIAVLGLVMTAEIVKPFIQYKREIIQFLTTATYLFAGSLIYTGFFQLYFARYIADRIFEEKFDMVLPNIIGMLFITMLGGAIVVFPSFFILTGTPLAYKLTFFFSFLVLSGMWILNIVISALKNYKYIFYSFLISYFVIFLLSLFFVFINLGLVGLMTAFLIGHALLFFLLFFLILFEFSSNRFIEFDFLRKKRIYNSLLWSGLFFNIGIWIDRIIFWLHPDTGENIISVLRASIFYDLPMFLAFIGIVPGMALFLLRLETDFAEKYDEYYDAVRGGATLKTIEEKRVDMILTAKTSLFEVFRGQLIVSLLLIILGRQIFELLGFPILYIPTYNIVVIGTWLLLFFLSILTIMFYLDRRSEVVVLTFLMMVFNGAFTFISIELGLEFYGIGFDLANLLVCLAGLYLLSKDFDKLSYETFMLQ